MKTNTKCGVWVNKNYQTSTNKAEGYDTWYDSKFEFNVYLKLLGLGLEPVRQVPLLIKPGTLYFPARYWKVDFYLPSIDTYVEAKGSWIIYDSTYKSEFIKTLEFLEYVNSEIYSKLLIVSDKKLKLKRVSDYTIEEIASKIKEIKEANK